MKKELRILFLEDNPPDAALVEKALKKGGFPVSLKRVDTEEEFLREWKDFSPDLIFSDYTLPSFSGHAALALIRKTDPEIPFIFVSGSIGEERAIEALKDGATDYVLKDRLGKLVPAVERALREVQERRDKKVLQAQLFQAQKLEAIGRLAAGVAHDFNNLLTAVAGYSELILQSPKIDPRLTRFAQEIHSAAGRATQLTKQLLAFSRREERSARILDLNQVVSHLEEMLRRLIGAPIALMSRLAPDLGSVYADPLQMEQVIMNLVVNAGDAMPQGGTIVIETSNVDLEKGPHVSLAIRDTGCGMDGETLEKIFEPFFTTKELGKGTGLGLSVVFGIVKQSGGSIDVSSQPGKGTEFRIYFPRT
jgi:signal transduction histidine kinase